MSSQITIRLNGTPVAVPAGATVDVAIAISGQPCRISVTGEPRGPLCGMGICFECRVNVNGISHSRGCQILCEPDMEVKIDD